MTDVLAAIVGSVGLVAVAILTPFAAVIAGRLRAVQEQVENAHKKPDGTPLNLRDDLDAKHVENRGILLTLQRDMAWVMRRLAEQDDRIDLIEQTQPTRKRERP